MSHCARHSANILSSIEVPGLERADSLHVLRFGLQDLPGRCPEVKTELDKGDGCIDIFAPPQVGEVPPERRPQRSQVLPRVESPTSYIKLAWLAGHRVSIATTWIVPRKQRRLCAGVVRARITESHAPKRRWDFASYRHRGGLGVFAEHRPKKLCRTISLGTH